MSQLLNLKHELAQFTGSEQVFFNPLYREMKYTEGVKYLATTAGAYWLLDIIGTEYFPKQKSKEFDYFVSIKFEVEGSLGVITVGDGNNNVYLRRVIEFTDFPEGAWDFWLIDSVLLLPSEY